MWNEFLEKIVNGHKDKIELEIDIEKLRELFSCSVRTIMKAIFLFERRVKEEGYTVMEKEMSYPRIFYNIVRQ